MHGTVSSIGLSWIDGTPQEVVYALLSDLRVEATASAMLEEVNVSMGSIRIDNMLKKTTNPVILSHETEPPSQAASNTTIVSSNVLTFQVARFVQSSGILFHLQHVILKINQTLHCSFEEEFLAAVKQC